MQSINHVNHMHNIFVTGTFCCMSDILKDIERSVEGFFFPHNPPFVMGKA